MDNLPKKNIKYYDSTKRNINYETKTNVDKESYLLHSQHESKKKGDNYDTPVNREIKYGNHFGPGRGHGNAEINNFIRNSECSRLTNNEFNLERESEIGGIRDILMKNPQNVNNIILPFPRGGESTRKSVNSHEDDNKKFEFKY